MQTVLVTGGAGYIGSHICVELLEAGYQVVVIDNLCNSCEAPIARIGKITGTAPDFFRMDIRDADALSGVFRRHAIDMVIHLAGLKAVDESLRMPEQYHDNNVRGSITLTEVMAAHNCRNLVFSSSATVYGFSSDDPIPESAPTRPSAPYGENKLAVERHLAGLCETDPRWSAISLRYFNPVGAHPSGRIGEDPEGIPNNLTPFITQVAIGRRESLAVFGDDYPTRDGTCLRDYIHVVDLALGHVAALRKLAGQPGHLIVNLGTGRPYSVLEVHAAFEKAVGKTIPHTIVSRRDGDVAVTFADPSLAKSLFGWQADRDMETMAADAWRWQSQNPDGYADG